METQRFFTIEEIHQAYCRGVLAQSLVPMEWELSLPMPTLRFIKPAYCWFVTPAVRQPGKPLKLSAPEISFALDAVTGEPLMYNSWELPDTAIRKGWQSVELPLSSKTREEAQNSFIQLLTNINQATLALFTGRTIDFSCAVVIVEYLNPQMLPWYRFIAPDFWASLDRSLSTGR